MDSQTIIERIQRDVKDKTLLVRFYSLQNGADLWIDGLNWRLYDYDMKEYLHEEYGIEIDVQVSGITSYEVLKGDTDLVNKACFKDGAFSTQDYDELNESLTEMSDDAILAGLELGIPLDGMVDKYRGKWNSFADYVKDSYTETCEEEVKHVLRYFDWDDSGTLVEEWEQDYSHHEGHVFDATL